MRKKSAFLAAAFLAALIGHACKMPIEIKVNNIRYDIPLKTANFNLATILMESLKDSFGDGEVEIYDMPGWTQSQAFLVSYVMKDLAPDFNPQTYLDDIKIQLEKMNPDENKPDIGIIYPEPITIPKLTPDPIERLEWFDMQTLFQSMQSWLNTTSVPPMQIGMPASVPIVGGVPYSITVPSFPPFLVFTDEVSPTQNFETVLVYEGFIYLNVELRDPGNTLDSDITVTLDGIVLKEEDPSVTPIGSIDKTTIILNSSNHFQDQAKIDLSGASISATEKPQFKMDSITIENAGSLKLVQFDIVLQPEVVGISLNGATGLQVGEMILDLPDEVVNAFTLGHVPDEFLNAVIADGSVILQLELPPENPPADPSLPPTVNSDSTYCEGVIIEYQIFLEQDPYQTPAIGGKVFEGLSPGIGEPWIISSDSANSLNNKSINRNDLNVDRSSSKMVIKTDNVHGGMSFKLIDNDRYHYEDDAFDAYFDKCLPIRVKANMEINELEVVRWKLEGSGGDSVIPSPDIPEIDFGNLGETSAGAGDGKNVAAFVEYIVFEEIKLGIDFSYPDPLPSPMHTNDTSVSGDPGLPVELRNRLAMKVSCPDLGLNRTQFLTAGPIEYVSENPDTPGSTEIRFDLNDTLSNPKKLQVNVDLMPVIDGVPDPDAEYIELGPFTLGGGDIRLNICATADISFKWKEALLHPKKALEDANPDSLDALSGTYPEKAEDYIDLSMMRQYLNGITYRTEHLDAKLFLAGPPKLINLLNLSLQFGAEYMERINLDDDNEDDPANWIDKSWNDIVGGALLIYDPDNYGDALPSLPGPIIDTNGNEQWVYPGTNLPTGTPDGLGLDTDFLQEIVKGPRDMRFTYEMVLPDDLLVTPDMFPDTETQSTIDVQFIMRLPLEFHADAGAEFALPDDVIDKDKDLFGRETKNDPIFGDMDGKIDITKVAIKLDFSSQPFFAGTRLHIGGYPDGVTKLFGPNGINLVSGNSLAITFSKRDWDIINGDLILPDIKLVYPQARDFSIPRNFKPTHITIEATGSYTDTIELDSLLGN